MNITDLMKAFAAIQQQQQQGEAGLLAQKIDAMDPLGKVARSNARPTGLTAQNDWNAIFNTGGRANGTQTNPEALGGAVNNPGRGFSWEGVWANTASDPRPMMPVPPAPSPEPVFPQLDLGPDGLPTASIADQMLYNRAFAAPGSLNNVARLPKRPGIRNPFAP